MGVGASRQSSIRLEGKKERKRGHTNSGVAEDHEGKKETGGVTFRKPKASNGSVSTSRSSRSSRDSRLSKHTSFYEMLDASEINSYLIVGNQPCVENDDFLKRKNILYVLNLSNMAVPCIKDGIEYKTILLDDEDEEDLLNHLDECLDFLRKAKKKCESAKGHILVYSFFGLSRCCAVSLAHTMKENGWTLQQAWKYLRQRRPTAKPSDSFLLQLLQYEGRLKGKYSMTMQDFYAR